MGSIGNQEKAIEILELIYKEKATTVFLMIEELLKKYESVSTIEENWVDQNDAIVITYADSIVSDSKTGIANLEEIFTKYVGDSVSAIHLLPFFDSSSDDGFSVIDYKKPMRSAGTWQDIDRLSSKYELMFDAVINHISQYSDWFKGYLAGDEKYKNYFIECDPDLDYTNVTRPRALPLHTKVSTASGEKYVWTTFSEDQIDLNYKDENLLIDILDVLLYYVKHGARYIRLDAIGFMWKEIGTSCMHHKNTHELIRLMRYVVERVDKRVILITETNTPHAENISYFGKKYDEAHMVYQFPLPLLTAHMFLLQDSTVLLKWYDGLGDIDKRVTFFNFLASHDGIGVRPTEGILEQAQVDEMVDMVKQRGGRISYRNMPDGSKKPYELNISFFSLIGGDVADKDLKVAKFMASQAVLLSVIGVPGVYIHSLFGSKNDNVGMEESGINRRINREKLDKTQLIRQLSDENTLRSKVLKAYTHMLNTRKQTGAFSPMASQTCDFIDKRVFAISRKNAQTGDSIRVRINISDSEVFIDEQGKDILSGLNIERAYCMRPYEVLWIK